MNPVKNPGKRPPQRPPKNQRIVCLWLPNWSIQRMVVAAPELRRQRIVLFVTDSRRGRLVAAVSPLALRDGIRVAMPLSEAKSLLQRSDGEFHVFEHDPAADFSALEALADTLERFSPIVGLEQIEPAASKRGQQPVSVLLDVTGLDRLFGDERQLAAKILEHVGQLGYIARIACANTVGVAWGASRFLNHRAVEERVGQDSSLIIPPDDTHTFSQLPIETLRLEPATVATLHQLGIETNEQLERLSRSDLAMRFGNAIHRRLDQATGHIEEPVIARQRPPEFQAQQLLDYPTNHRETIEVIIARLITGICEELRGRQKGGLQWMVRLLLVDEPLLDFTVSLFQPTAVLKQIMPLVEMQLDQVLTSNNRSTKRRKTTHFQVQEIQVGVTASVLLVEQQRQLFDENPRLDKQALAQLINRLTTRLGQQNVVYPQLQAGAQPEFSYRFRSLVDVHRKRTRRPTKLTQQSHVAARPLRIFHPPVAVEMKTNSECGVRRGIRNSECGVQNLEVEMGGRRPEAGRSESECLSGYVLGPREAIDARSLIRQSQSIVRSWGPERIETGWWRGRTVCRDYWRIETDRGQQFWLYRDLRVKQWFVQGEF